MWLTLCKNIEMLDFEGRNIECAAVVFDHDDTGMVTRKTKYPHMIALGQEYGLEITTEQLDESWGTSFEIQLTMLYGDADSVEGFKATFRRLEPDYPKIAQDDYSDFLHRLDIAGIPYAKVTSHNAGLTRSELITAGIDPDGFLFIHGSEETAPFHKPDGRVFDHAKRELGRLGIHPDDTVYIGDDIKDQAAATDAGWQFIGVETGAHTREHFGADALVVPRLAYIGVRPDILHVPNPDDLVYQAGA